MKEKILQKTSVKQKIGYAFGQFSDSIPFNLFYTYFLYFLTDVAGLPAVYGGIISLIVVIWDGITDPLIGYFSDKCNSKYGRRRPFMLAALIPLLICTVLLFTKVEFSQPVAFVYYVLIGILYWTSYTAYVIPFFALGAELTQDFNDRTTLRGFAGVVIYVAIWIVAVGPMFVLDEVTERGGTEAQSWIISTIICGSIAVIGGLICWNSTRGKELVDNADINIKDNSKLISNYIELFKQKAFRRYLIMVFVYNIAFAIAQAAFVYIMNNNLELSPSKQALYWTWYSILTISFVPICNIVANLFGKKQSMIVLNAICIVGCLFYFFYGIPSFLHLIIFTGFYNIGNVCYWSVGYSMMYDCVELDEFVTGKRREGAITGFSSFMQKFGSAAGMYITGALLTMFGYDGTAEAQTEHALNGIITVNTLIPALLIMLGTVFIIIYPVTKERFEALLEALELKKQNKEYSMDKIKKLF